MTQIKKINFDKFNGLVPVIVIDIFSNQVLMLGFMNNEAFEITLKTNKVTFYSRSRKCLWTKGETSGNFLHLEKYYIDCDNDTILVYAKPQGPTCHLGNFSCFSEISENNSSFLDYLYKFIEKRKVDLPQNSYTTKLFKEGHNRIIQKVGEEAIETVIAAKNKDRVELINESSDLIFHLMVLLAEQNINFLDVVKNLKKRHILSEKK